MSRQARGSAPLPAFDIERLRNADVLSAGGRTPALDRTTRMIMADYKGTYSATIRTGVRGCRLRRMRCCLHHNLVVSLTICSGRRYCHHRNFSWRRSSRAHQCRPHRSYSNPPGSRGNGSQCSNIGNYCRRKDWAARAHGPSWSPAALPVPGCLTLCLPRPRLLTAGETADAEVCSSMSGTFICSSDLGTSPPVGV